MKAIAFALRAFRFFLLAGVTVIFACLAWEATQHIPDVGEFLAQYLSDFSRSSLSEVAWTIVAALFAPWLGLMLWLVILCHIADHSSDPSWMRKRAETLMREAEAIERYQAARRQDLLRISRVHLDVRQPEDLPRR